MEWKQKGNALEASGKTKDALTAYENALKKNPDDSETLVKIGKQYADMMTSLTGAARKEAGRKSLEFSRKALAVDPKSPNSHLAVALSLGKNTDFMGSKEKLQASREIKTEADIALRLNPKSDYAHHVLGRWNQEMAGIGGTSRLIAEAIYGAVPKGSYEEALRHFDTARKLMPKRLIHQIEYGRTLAMMGNNEDAKKEIQKGLDMPNRDADDADYKASGRKTLDGL